MSEVAAGMPTTDAITAAMETMGQASAPPETPAPAAPAVEEPAPAEAKPAPSPETPPAPLELSDSALVVDPADKQVKPWGEIKAERLRQVDYTRKTMSLAEERKALAAERAQAVAEMEAAKAKVAIAALPELPADDPYAAHIAQVRQQNEAILAAQQEAVKAANDAAIEAARARLDADISRVTGEFKLEDREMNYVGQEFYRRINSGENVSLDMVAKEFSDYRAAQKEAAVKEWKEAHRVGAEPAAAATPAAPAPAAAPLPGQAGFLEAVMSHMGIKT